MKNTHKAGFSVIFTDAKLNEPVIAPCIPFLNSTEKRGHYDGATWVDDQSKQGRDDKGLVGVACTGVLLKKFSEELLSYYGSDDNVTAYIVERSSGYLVAVSINTGNSGYGGGGETGFFEYTGVNSASAKILAANSAYTDVKWSYNILVNDTAAWAESTDELVEIRDSSYYHIKRLT